MIKAWKQSKYHAIRTQNADGTWSDSLREARFDAQIMLLQHDPKTARVVRKEKFPIVVNGEKICTFVSDWFVEKKTGEKIVYDAKGVKTPIYKLKKKLVKALYGLDIVEL